MITINDKWRIRKDQHNYIPEMWQESKQINKGKHQGKTTEAKYSSIERYYGTLDKALEGILRYEMEELSEQDHDVQSFLKELREVVAGLNQSVKEVLK